MTYTYTEDSYKVISGLLVYRHRIADILARSSVHPLLQALVLFATLLVPVSPCLQNKCSYMKAINGLAASSHFWPSSWYRFHLF